jgi:hypothetical protein
MRQRSFESVRLAKLVAGLDQSAVEYCGVETEDVLGL